MKATIKLVKPVVTPIESCTLELSKEELATVFAVLRCVGGNPAMTPRKHVDNVVVGIRVALREAGVDETAFLTGYSFDRRSMSASSMYFEPLMLGEVK